MRIAICVSGQPRTWRATRASLMAFFAGHDLDVFLHTWREGDPAELQAVLDAYAPRAARVEDRPLFLEEKRRLAELFPEGPPLFIFDMFHSVAESLALAAEAGSDYDLVVRTRFDALLDGVWSGEEPVERALIIPDLYPLPTGCTDQFAMGRPAEMQMYASAGVWLTGALERIDSSAWFRPEPVLRHYLEAICQLRIDIRPIPMKLLRDEQVGRAFADIGDDPVFHAAKHEAWEAFALEQFPDTAARADFSHVGRVALDLERALTNWLQSRQPKDAFQLLRAPWSRRIEAVDAFIRELSGGAQQLDEAGYRSIRLGCAMLLQRMAPNEPMNLESFVVHALSANAADKQCAAVWLAVEGGKLDRLQALFRKLGPLAQAFTFANPLEQPSIGAWRPR